MTLEEKLKQFREEIRRHERLYYIEHRPEIDDFAFDQLMRNLQTLEAEHPELITPDSPSQRVGGAPVSGFAPVLHDPPMLSIDNAYSIDELREWVERVARGAGSEKVDYFVDLKIDGVSLDLLYENGVLVRGATRGDGVRGDDVTSNVKTIRSLPLRIDTTLQQLEVRGEVYLDKRQFARHNEVIEEEGGEPHANPRNSAAGAIRLKDPKEAAARGLSAFVYQVVRADDRVVETQEEAYALMLQSGFAVNPGHHRCRDLDEVLAFIAEWEKKRFELDFEIDGIVVKVNRRGLQQKLGATSKAPRWAIAFKYPPETAETIIREISTQVGRTGVITPVGHFDPVTVGGSTIRRATLHNFDEIRRKDIRVGDSVVVEKGGEVIPKVSRVIMEKRPPETEPVRDPANCPECHQPVHRFEGEVAFRCVNASCPGIVKQALAHFAARKAMDIEGLGEKVIDALFARDLLKDVASIYALTKEELMELEGFAARKTEKLLEQIDRSRTTELERLLFAIGIRFVGERAARILAQHFRSLDALVEAKQEELITISEIGPKVAESVVFFFSLDSNRSLVERLKSFGVRPTVVEKKKGSKFAGKTFVVTGTLERYSRDAIHQLIESEGGKASGSVSGKTSFVVAGSEAGSKLEKAKKLGVAVLTEEEFLRLVE